MAVRDDDLVAAVDDSDLVYDGRARKRPPGASDLTQRIYGLLSREPAGMTRDQVWEQLREGWLDTDAYRAYENQRRHARGKHVHKSTCERVVEPYGTDRFKASAQKWYIDARLRSMGQAGTARRDGGRWYATGKQPRAWVACDWRGGHLVPVDPAQQHAHHHADTSERVHREQVKTELWEALKDGRIKGRTRDVIQHAYDYLRGSS